MKILKTYPDRCIGCLVCEAICSETYFDTTDSQKSAIRILDDEAGGGDYRIVVCQQLGDCIDVCPAAAIRRLKSGVVTINKKKCVGCYACVGFCPIQAMYSHPDEIVPFKCIACGKCADECPTEALEIVEVDDLPRTATEKWLSQ
jgi:carbon-monoxide dehydrogenase iron sulfur subunit